MTIFNLPRLSVDIDLDYVVTNSKEDMLENRENQCHHSAFYGFKWV